MKKNRIDVQHLHSVPSYSLLYHDKYRWVPDYLEMLDTQKQIRELENEKKRVGLVLPTQADFLHRLKTNYDALVERQAANLLEFLINQYQNPNPVDFLRLRLASDGQQAPFLIPTWESILAAAEKINIKAPTIEEKELPFPEEPWRSFPSGTFCRQEREVFCCGIEAPHYD